MRKMIAIVGALALSLSLCVSTSFAANGNGGPAPCASIVQDQGPSTGQLGGGALALLLGAGCVMGVVNVANRGIPGPQDSSLVLQAAVTKTADFDGAGLDLGSGWSPGGIGKPMAAVITTTALDVADGNETYAFHLESSDDNITFADCGVPASVTAAGVSICKGVVTKRYVRLILDVGGTTPSITYSAYLNPNV